MDFITELGAVLVFVTPLIVKLTNDIKPLVSKNWMFIIPYTLGILIALGLYLTFNNYGLGVYLINGVVFGLASQLTYEVSGAKKKTESTVKELETADSNTNEINNILDLFPMTQ